MTNPRSKKRRKSASPKFPQPESYRNWRLRVREAVVAASDRPDDAFTWLSKVWEKDVKEEDLRDPEGFVTLDAKVLSAVTNILEGAFARQIDTFKEREANGGRLVRVDKCCLSWTTSFRRMPSMDLSMSLKTYCQ